MAFGITSSGFVKKGINDIIDEMIQDAQDSFGSNFDLRESTLQYQIILNFARQFSTLWDTAESLYNNRFVNLAENVELDYAVKFTGLRRSQPIKSTGQITITGDNGTIVPIGFIIQTSAGIQFQTTQSGTISSGTLDLNIEALVSGNAGNVAASSITVITNPLVGVASVNNSAVTSNGENKETDSELRTRYFDSLARGGGSTTNAIRAALLELSGVQDVIVRENDTLTTDADSLPGKSIGPVVLGGTNSDIFQSIFDNKPAGIRSFGSLTQDITDNNNNVINIGFTRPTNQNVWINATVTTDSNYPTDGNTQVQTIIVNTINNLNIGESVILFEILTAVGSGVEGITNLVLQSSTDGTTFTSADVTITGISKAVTDNTRVVVS